MRKRADLPPESAGAWSRFVDDLSVHVSVGGRYRSSSLVSLAAGLGLAWRGVFLGAAYEPARDWEVDTLPVEVQTVAVRAGWAPLALDRGRWHGELGAAFVADLQWVKRLQLVGAGTRFFGDLGAALVARGSAGVGAGLRVGLGLQAAWYPAGHEIEIEPHPTRRLNLVSVRLGLFLAWHPGELRRPRGAPSENPQPSARPQ